MKHDNALLGHVPGSLYHPDTEAFYFSVISASVSGVLLWSNEDLIPLLQSAVSGGGGAVCLPRGSKRRLDCWGMQQFILLNDHSTHPPFALSRGPDKPLHTTFSLIPALWFHLLTYVSR